MHISEHSNIATLHSHHMWVHKFIWCQTIASDTVSVEIATAKNIAIVRIERKIIIFHVFTLEGPADCPLRCSSEQIKSVLLINLFKRKTNKHAWFHEIDIVFSMVNQRWTFVLQLDVLPQHCRTTKSIMPYYSWSLIYTIFICSPQSQMVLLCPIF